MVDHAGSFSLYIAAALLVFFKREACPVKYRDVGREYFQERALRRYAGVWSLWALGVGGFGGLAIATVIVAVMYLGICYSIAEMSPALPHTGGAYSFGRTAMGPWGGFITGLAENV